MCAISALFITVGAVMTLHFYLYGRFTLYIGLLSLFFLMYLWWKDVIREATFLGYHTVKVVLGLKLGMLLFIVSEVMFFFSFFWAFFHSSLAPHFIIGSVWPPIGINILYPLHIPFLNTFILLISGFTVTVCHYGVCVKEEDAYHHIDVLDLLEEWQYDIDDNYFGFFDDDIFEVFEFLKKYVKNLKKFHYFIQFDKGIVTISYFLQIFVFLGLTIFLAVEFTLLQGLEYFEALFYINDNVYGSSFYLTTGFHGLHVIIGTIFLVVSFVRLLLNHYTPKHHLGLEFAIWYWHFVDVVWLFLFVMVYLWGTGNFLAI
jgi:heme/copper-type cytochrome/quinol oxidase subunit 3